jgi:hypothetical protein
VDIGVLVCIGGNRLTNIPISVYDGTYRRHLGADNVGLVSKRLCMVLFNRPVSPGLF